MLLLVSLVGAAVVVLVVVVYVRACKAAQHDKVN